MRKSKEALREEDKGLDGDRPACPGRLGRTRRRPVGRRCFRRHPCRVRWGECAGHAHLQGVREVRCDELRTPVHTGASGSSAVTGHIAAGRTVRLHYRCVNSAGNTWYEITGHLDDNAPGTPVDARFIYSGYL